MLARSLKIHKSLPEDFRSETLLRKLRFVSSLINAQQKAVLDAGCGNGLARKFLSESVMYLGVDFNAKYLKGLWQAGNSVPRLAGTVTHLPLKENLFDVVLNLNVIEHLPRELQKKMLMEFFRTLKIGGCLILITDNIETLFHAKSFLTPNNPKHQQCLMYKDVETLLRRCGFQKIARGSFDIVLDYPNRLLRILPFILRNRLARYFPKLDKFIVVEAVKA